MNQVGGAVQAIRGAIQALPTDAPRLPRKEPVAGDRKKTGYVYLIEGAGLTKIGRALDAYKRLAGLRSQCPVPLTMVLCAYVRDYTRVEAYLHALMADKRCHGEWFDLGEDDVSKIREELGQ